MRKLRIKTGQAAKETVQLPRGLIEKVNRVAKPLGFRDVEEFIECAVRRLLDRYQLLLRIDQ